MFEATLFKIPGPGGWTFVAVPAIHAPPRPTQGWGRTPVVATVDGRRWATSVWWDTNRQQTPLAVPRRIRGSKGDGDCVAVSIVVQGP